MRLLLLLVWLLLPAYGAVGWQRTVRGVVGESLLVTCKYRHGLETKPKFWCKPGTVYICAGDIVITSESQPVVQKGRFSIRDNRTRREFTVTVEDLANEDAGIYCCGVRRGIFQHDECADVKTDAPQGSRGSFRYFPVLAGLQLLVLLAMSAAVLWVSLRG